MTLGSLFSGSGGFELAASLNGITPVWASEIQAFPIAVTKARFPHMKHYGDVCKLKGDEIEPVDIITFGSPCQDLSIAGKRQGLQEGERSNLFYEAVRIIKEMRAATNGKYPRFAVWENVYGAFSSNQGEDFRCVLESLCRVADETVSIPRPPKGKWLTAGEIMGDSLSLSWRGFDAQHWGVPQRRKRIYLVADFVGQCAGKILFESESLPGYSPQGWRAWQGTAASAESRFGTAVLNDQGGASISVSEDVTATLRAEAHGNNPAVLEMYEKHSQDSRYTGPLEKSQTVLAAYGTGGNNQPFVLRMREGCGGGGKGPLIQENRSGTLGTHNDQYVFGICSAESNAMKSANPHSGFYEAETARTIDTSSQSPSRGQGGNCVVSVQGSMIGREEKNDPAGSGVGEDVSFTLNTVDRHGVAYGIDRAAFNQGQNAQYNITIEAEKNSSLVAKGPSAVGQPVYSTSHEYMHTYATEDTASCLAATDHKDPPTVCEEPYYIVRRLTPVECGRLQGFPDWWCEGIENTDPTEEDMAFWREIMPKKTDKQIRKWLADPRTDSAEYMMWGNGVALPNAYYVMFGIAQYPQQNFV